MRWIWSWMCWSVVMLGYRVRPYDMLTDRRRWFWQPRTTCNRSQVEAHLAACERMAAHWAEGDERIRRALWTDVHTTADHLRSNLGR